MNQVGTQSSGVRSQVILLLCHRTSGDIIKLFDELVETAGPSVPVYWLYHAKGKTIPPVLKGYRRYAFSDESIANLNLPTIRGYFLPGHTQYPLFCFLRDNPIYDYYWLIEYDVRFSGYWEVFFERFWKEDKDFLTCHIRGFKDEPKWPWWRLYHCRDSIPIAERLRSFNPIYRISNSALQFLHQSIRSGWCGHAEVLMPTLLYRSGFRIMDFGGNGRFVPPELKNKFYTSGPSNQQGILSKGTMRFRPSSWKAGKEKDKLYHPVKPLDMFVRERLDSYRRRVGKWLKSR